MAVLGGARRAALPFPGAARPVPGAVPGATPRPAAPLARRRPAPALRARRAPSRAALLLAGIVVAFFAAFFSLSQGVAVSATGYETNRLTTERLRMEARAAELRNEVNRLGRTPAIRQLAIDAGLGPLPEPIVVDAR